MQHENTEASAFGFIDILHDELGDVLHSIACFIFSRRAGSRSLTWADSLHLHDHTVGTKNILVTTLSLASRDDAVRVRHRLADAGTKICIPRS